MINYNEIKKGTYITINNEPYLILEASPMFKGRGHSVVQAKIKNLVNGNIYSKTFHPSDSFEEANITNEELKFIYSHRGKYVFSDSENKRIEINEEIIKPISDLLKEGQEVNGIKFQGKLINISLPIKITLAVKESPPGVRAGRAESGTKQVVLETGAKINVPLFIKEGDLIEINTETKEYTRRI